MTSFKTFTLGLVLAVGMVLAGGSALFAMHTSETGTADCCASGSCCVPGAACCASHADHQ
ncbi:MAG: hypothetical protein ACREEM_07295 [Blastocatellia bacterium]